MTSVERKEMRRRLALLERASALFDRFGVSVPLAIAFLNHWPTEIKSYQDLVTTEAWKIFLSCALYELAAFALRRAVKFAKAGLVP